MEQVRTETEIVPYNCTQHKRFPLLTVVLAKIVEIRCAAVNHPIHGTVRFNEHTILIRSFP